MQGNIARLCRSPGKLGDHTHGSVFQSGQICCHFYSRKGKVGTCKDAWDGHRIDPRVFNP